MRVAIRGMSSDVAPRPECHDCDWSLGPMRRVDAESRLKAHVIAKGHSGAVVTEHREIWEPRNV